jgi:hypothetical protein
MPSTQYKWLAGERYVTVMCPRCHWPFACPIEQFDSRIECRACESKND